MNRPTRVPASTVVRMNRASNMIAKWYQKAFSASPVAPEKISDIPMASVGAPPVRATSDSSCTSRAAEAWACGEIVEAEPVHGLRGGLRRCRPTTAAGAFIA